jgi:hypothetical protein
MRTRSILYSDPRQISQGLMIAVTSFMIESLPHRLSQPADDAT